MQPWNSDWFPLPGPAVFDPNHQEVVVVSRGIDDLDLFVVGNDSHVWSTYWHSASGWSANWFPLPGKAVFDLQNQRVAAVSRAPGNLDLFIVGNDGHIWSTYWNDSAGWSADWFPLPGQAVFDLTTQHVTVVSRTADNLDLFIVGNDSHVWSTAWNSTAGWNADWAPLPGQAVFDLVTQQVAAVSRASDNLDLFIIGNDSHVWSTFWNSSSGWNSDWFPLPGQAVFDLTTQRVTVVSRAPGNLDLFIVGNDSHVWSTYWNSNSGWSSDWFPLPGNAVFDLTTQHVAAVSSSSEYLDLFIVGNESHVWSTSWNSSVGWNADWAPVPGQAVFDFATQQVAGISRSPANLDLFIIGNDGHIWSTFADSASIVLSAPLVSGGLAAFGGWITITINPDGSVRWQGHAHDSGADGYDYWVSAVVTSPSGASVAVAHSGSVGGTFTSGSRNEYWDVTYTNKLPGMFPQFSGAKLYSNLQYTSDIGSFLGDAVEWVLKFALGSTVPGMIAGFIIFLGVEIGSLAMSGSLVPGAVVISGTLFMAGPFNSLLALGAAAIVSVGSKSRQLTQEEYDWANGPLIYAGALPPIGTLLLTDTIIGGRAFTFPRWDGKIAINIGPDAYNDPRRFQTTAGRKYGEIFAHELLHACQMASAPSSIDLMACAISAKLCGASAYKYPNAGADYVHLGLEEQAQIVGDWASGSTSSGDQTGVAEDVKSPYYTYIINNVRTRILWAGV